MSSFNKPIKRKLLMLCLGFFLVSLMLGLAVYAQDEISIDAPVSFPVDI
ncbi:MAG: hypothetical protein AAF403_06895 [Pseudomonadota bacterium]